jgi:DNA-binding LacI/PurR family transcriptional regulator
MAKQVTIQDVAAEAGVSLQTVSRVINGKPDVAEETRKRVWQVARRLGYRPSSIARSLVLRRTYTLGLITCPINDQFRAEVITGAEREARARGYVFVLAITDGNPDDVPLMYNLMMERQVDGLLLFAPSVSPQESLAFELPVVSLAYRLESERAINVDVDNVDGAYQAVHYLTSLGHRRVGIVAGPAGWHAATDRTEGARRALAEVGQPLDNSYIEVAGDWTLEAGYSAARALLARHADCTALFCHSDWIALGAYRALRELGQRIPEDVSVVGYDDLPICDYVSPPLASVRQPRAALGELLAQLLVGAVERGMSARQDVLVRAEFVPRGSIAPAPSP